MKKAEDLSNSTSWNKTGKQLIQLQEEWKNSAFVPKNLSDKIWKRFRTACKTFFDARKKTLQIIRQRKRRKPKRKNNFIKKKLKKFDVFR